MRYKGKVYRPPSEAYSLIVQVTYGCSHNRCAFCDMYDDKHFAMRPMDEIREDFELARRVYRRVERVFLADGDALMRRTGDLVEILGLVYGLFPECQRVTCYASPTSLQIKSEDELRLLRSKGLQMVYMGLESGCDAVLEKMHDKDRLVELDWYEDAVLENGFAVHCLPPRHFSGRGLKANQTLWASFLIETPSQKIYMAGDGGYDSHFEEIGKHFPDIDLAILENGQYNEGWNLIHLMPSNMAKAAKDLKAKKIMTVHHSKYALAKHPWNEPLTNEKKMQEQDSLNMMIPEIGEVMPL